MALLERLKRDRIPEAIEFHRKAHHLKEDNTRPLYALVDDHEARGDIDRARVVLGRIARCRVARTFMMTLATP